MNIQGSKEYKSDESTSDDSADADLRSLVADLAAKVEAQEARIADLEATVDEQRETIESQAETIADQQATIEDCQSWIDRKDETIRGIVANLNEVADEVDAILSDGDLAGETPAESPGLEPASSPLDFYCNCQQYNVDRHLSANRARAVEIVRRHDEFARRKRALSTPGGTSEADGSVVFTREDVEMGLVAILGREPHNQTVARVWTYVRRMAGDDAETHRFRDRRSGTRRDGIRFDAATLERYDEERYVGRDLLSDATDVDPQDGVTPVVIG